MPKARGHGEGTVRFHKATGRYEALEPPRDAIPRGEKRQSAYGKSKSEALRKMREKVKAREDGISPASAKQSLAEYLKGWISGPLQHSGLATLAAFGLGYVVPE